MFTLSPVLILVPTSKSKHMYHITHPRYRYRYLYRMDTEEKVVNISTAEKGNPGLPWHKKLESASLLPDCQIHAPVSAEPLKSSTASTHLHAAKFGHDLESQCVSVLVVKKMRKTTECVVPPTTAHRNRLSEQTVKTESRRTSALIGFDINLDRRSPRAALWARSLAGVPFKQRKPKCTKVYTPTVLHSTRFAVKKQKKDVPAEEGWFPLCSGPVCWFSQVDSDIFHEICLL